jgi:hypothetical protein
MADSGGGGLVRRGPNSGPLPANTMREPPSKARKPNVAVTVADLPEEIVATLQVLVEIELCRLERILPKAKPTLDVVRATQDDAVLK